MTRDMVQVRRGPVQRHSGPEAKIGRSQFNRSHGLKTTFPANRLVPIFVDEVLPGDTFTCSLNGFARIFSPLLAPIMDNIELETFFFFVPNRLVWENWEAFNGAHDAAGAQDTTFTIPVMATGVTVDHSGVTTVHGLAAYFGLPEGMTTSTGSFNSLPFRGYNLIYNEFFRDQNLKAELTVLVNDADDAHANYQVRKTNKKHDYFTSCLPYLQKGTAISVALQGVTDLRTVSQVASHVSVVADSSGTPTAQEMDIQSGNLGIDATTGTATEQLFVDLSIEGAAATGVPSIDINALRQSVAIQRLLERDARGGTRYTEILKSHFGVTSPDFRLQRPEYLGGGKSFINVSAVANTSAVDSTVSVSGSDEPSGELVGVGTGVISGHGWAKSFVEHGFVIGLVRARGDLTYFQGLDRFWSRSTRYDYYIPALAMLGEQSVLNSEIWISNSAAIDDAVFGYQERWAEYRTKQSKITGLFEPNVSGSLNFWHLAEDFSSLPALNTTFMESNTPMARVRAVSSGPDFILDLWFNFKCARPIPVRSIPSLIGHF